MLAVKANQEGLHQATQALFERLDAGEAMTHAISDATETGHGRVAYRKVTTLDAVQVLPDSILFAWPKLETLVRIQSRTQREGKLVEEERFYISTLPAQEAEVIGEAVKFHWGIENQLHWVLDVAFNEDRNRTRKGSAPESGALLRHITLNLLRQDPEKRSMPKRRMKAALSREYRMAALMGFNTQNESILRI